MYPKQIPHQYPFVCWLSLTNYWWVKSHGNRIWDTVGCICPTKSPLNPHKNPPNSSKFPFNPHEIAKNSTKSHQCPHNRRPHPINRPSPGDGSAVRHGSLPGDRVHSADFGHHHLQELEMAAWAPWFLDVFWVPGSPGRLGFSAKIHRG